LLKPVPLLGGARGGFQSSKFKVQSWTLDVGCWLLVVGCCKPFPSWEGSGVGSEFKVRCSMLTSAHLQGGVEGGWHGRSAPSLPSSPIFYLRTPYSAFRI